MAHPFLPGQEALLAGMKTLVLDAQKNSDVVRVSRSYPDCSSLSMSLDSHGKRGAAH